MLYAGNEMKMLVSLGKDSAAVECTVIRSVRRVYSEKAPQNNEDINCNQGTRVSGRTVNPVIRERDRG